jgi:hypothetical protein
MSKGVKTAVTGGKKAGIDVVAEDRNWVDRIQNELNCASVWTKDWFQIYIFIFILRGFLAAGA